MENAIVYIGVLLLFLLSFFMGMCQEARATKLKECEPISDRKAYEICLNEVKK